MGSGYIPAPSDDEMNIVDSYLPWRDPLVSVEEQTRELAEYCYRLQEAYYTFGPKIIKVDTVPSGPVLDAEVGDDHVQFTDAPMTFISELLSATDCIDAEISVKDTFVSSSYGNYSESYMLKPENFGELYYQQKSEKQDSPYLDIAKIRTILAVSSMRQKHSDTIDGKVSLLGQAAVYETPFCGYDIKIAQMLQSICLGLNKEKKFPYLPTYLGGFGSPPIFKNYKSFVRCMLAYKYGKYYDLLASIGSAVFELKTHGNEESRKFLSAIKGDAESWQDWYKAYTKYVPQVKGDIDPMLNAFCLGQLGKDEVWDSATRRLLKAGLLVTKTQLLVHEHMEDLTKILLSSENSVSLREKIENEKSSQRMISIFNSNVGKNLTYVKPRFLEPKYVDTIFSLSKSGEELLKSALMADYVYEGAALDLIKQISPVKVNLQMTNEKGLSLPILLKRVPKEEDAIDMQSMLDFVRGSQPALEKLSRKLISDDAVLIKLAEQWSNETRFTPFIRKVMVITTMDRALCLNINTLFPQIAVVRIRADRPEATVNSIKESLKQTIINADIRFFDDTGSINYYKDRIRYVKYPGDLFIGENKKARILEYVRVKMKTSFQIKPDKPTGPRRIIENRVQHLVVKADEYFDQQGLLVGHLKTPSFTYSRSLRDGTFQYSRDDVSSESDDTDSDLL